ncbi:MAG: hypothetical protein HY671_06290 [Chloroflexi bacterium]|nr:hypothetical protein [Chloroflexota bacterium]
MANAVQAAVAPRRHFLQKAGAALGAAALVALLRSKGASAQGKATFIARRVSQVPLDPEAPAWQQAEALTVSLAPQAVVKPRTYDNGVKDITARALYDDSQVGLLLEWGDKTSNTNIGRMLNFRDAAAVQFPADPSKKVPYFAMGEPNNPVSIYHWKADWQYSPAYDAAAEFKGMVADFYPNSGKGPGQIPASADYGKAGPLPNDKVYVAGWGAGNPISDPELRAKTPVEKLTAAGFGSLTTDSDQDGQGKAVWKDGRWQLALSIPRKQGQFEFAPGQTIPINFAAWDGGKNERGGEKGVSTWYFLSLEKPAGSSVFVLPLVAVAVVGLLEWLAIRGLRKRRESQKS